MRYLGVLKLLEECSVYVTPEIRESIEQAFSDACEANPTLAWRRVMNRVAIDVK